MTCNAPVRLTRIIMTLLLLANMAAGATEPSTRPTDESILTNATSLLPKINGASVYGQRPNRPFLYSIPTTGERPMTFSASGLPEGLKLDVHNGRIAGSVATAGFRERFWRSRKAPITECAATSMPISSE